MNVPVLLLDVDGVANALSKKRPSQVWPRDAWVTGDVSDGEGRTFPMMIARPVVEFFNALHSSGAAEVRWHTTWQSAAQNVADFAGFGRFEVADAPEFGDYRNFQRQAIMDGRPTWWKLPAAQRVVQEEKRDLIWIDDDLPYEYMRKASFDPKLGGERMVLLVDPFGQTGLLPRHLKQVEMFAAACAVEVK